MRIRPGIELAGLSDVGCQRENNEDCYAYWEPISEEQFQRQGRLAVVADGMGGYEGGQEASRIAVETIEEIYANAAGGDARTLLLKGFQTAHQRIQEYAISHPALHGMGTTCTAAALVDGSLYYVHVGDSRLYLVRNSSIHRLTHDHSYVGKLVEQGILNVEEAESHPQRNILTAALGVGEVAPESPPEAIALQEGDALVLCTDGLWSQVKDDELQNTVTAEKPRAACQELIHRARERGGPDNITVQILRLAARRG